MSEAGLQPSLVTRGLTVGAELTIAALLGLVLLGLGADGSAWILGGIAAGAIVVIIQQFCLSLKFIPNRSARKAGQMLVGLTVGFSIQQSNILALSVHIPLFVLLTLCLILSGLLAAFIYTRFEKIDLLTALLATTPGNIGVMASIAADYGKNPALVSLVQLMRFTAVTSIVPLLTQTTQKPNVLETVRTLSAQITAVRLQDLLWLGLVLFLATLSLRIGDHFKVPVAALVCPLVIGISFDAIVTAMPFLPPVDFNPPVLLNLFGQILLGITIGEYWGQNPAPRRSAIVYGFIPITLMLAAGFLTAALAKLVTGWDWVTCLLVAAPGGSPEMIWIALALDQDVEIVTASHLVRLLTLNGLLPFMITWSISWPASPTTPAKTPIINGGNHSI